MIKKNILTHLPQLAAIDKFKFDIIKKKTVSATELQVRSEAGPVSAVLSTRTEN
jgi:hypothetical protein